MGSHLALYFEPRDVWVGAYVSKDAVYVCLLPMVVLRWTRSRFFDDEEDDAREAELLELLDIAERTIEKTAVEAADDIERLEHALREARGILVYNLGDADPHVRTACDILTGALTQPQEPLREASK